MNIEVEERRPRIYVVVLEGDVDMSTSPAVRKALLSLFDTSPARIVVDLTNVSYIDSSGIATLIEGYQRSQRGGVRLTLAGMRGTVEAAFELAHLKEIFEVVPRVESALEGGDET